MLEHSCIYVKHSFLIFLKLSTDFKLQIFFYYHYLFIHFYSTNTSFVLHSSFCNETQRKRKDIFPLFLGKLRLKLDLNFNVKKKKSCVCLKKSNRLQNNVNDPYHDHEHRIWI